MLPLLRLSITARLGTPELPMPDNMLEFTTRFAGSNAMSVKPETGCANVDIQRSRCRAENCFRAE